MGVPDGCELPIGDGDADSDPGLASALALGVGDPASSADGDGLVLGCALPPLSPELAGAFEGPGTGDPVGPADSAGSADPIGSADSAVPDDESGSADMTGNAPSEFEVGEGKLVVGTGEWSSVSSPRAPIVR